MKNRLIVTGGEYSGWDSIANFLMVETHEGDIFDNSVTSLNKDLINNPNIDDAIIEQAEKYLVQLQKNNLAWADGLTIQLLEFWHTVNKNNRFILVYTSPDITFAKAIQATSGNLKQVMQVMKNWEETSKVTLNFFQQHRDTCLLVNASAAVEKASELATKYTKLSGKKITLSNNLEATKYLSTLAAKAATLLPNYDRLYELYDEMQSAASIPGSDIEFTGNTFKRAKNLASSSIEEFLLLQEQSSSATSSLASNQKECKELQTKSEQLQSSIDSKQQEREASLLQVQQLQGELKGISLSKEELETSSQEKVTQLQNELQAIRQELKSSQQKLEADQQEQELSLLQIQQLQEELESIFLNNQKLETSSQEKVTQLQNELQAIRQELKSSQQKLETDQQEQELSLLQIQQLQEELESIFLNKQKLEISSQEEATRLQEKLELSHQRYQVLQEKAAIYAGIASHLHPAEHAMAEGFEIINYHVEEGYEDLCLQINKLVLASGQRIEQLTCKLVLKENMVGLEFRRKDNPDNTSILNWPKEMQDAYGLFLLYIPEPTPENKASQESLLDNLSTNNRILLTSVINIISDNFMNGAVYSRIELEPEKLKQWRLLAHKLSQQSRNQAQFLTLDSVNLEEEYLEENYQHLWLKCNALQFGTKVFPDYSFKVASSSSETEMLLLEFRELENNRPPLEAWPPAGTDSHGVKLIIVITEHKNITYLDLQEELSDADKSFIQQLIYKLPQLLNQLEDQGASLKRGWPQWHAKIDSIASNRIIFGIAKRSVIKKLSALFKR